MTGVRFEPFIILIVLGFFCMANSNPITSLFGKSNDDKAEADDKVALSTLSTAKTAGEATTTTTTTTTTTPIPGSSCGGLKGFLHICDKNNPTEPPKSVKTRSVSEEDSNEDSDEDSNSEDDSDESEEKEKAKEEIRGSTETSPVVREATEGKISKRQVGDPEAPILGEVPPVISDAMHTSEEAREMKKRQADDSDSSSDSSEDQSEERRQRRDCRDRDGDYGKDCRRKRELVPTCFGNNCKSNTSPAA